MTSADVIVVGAGILGASAAYHLVHGGARVMLVDDAREGRATAAGAGIVCPWSSIIADPDWYALSCEGARDYPRLVERLAADGERETGYRRVGALLAPGGKAALDVAERRVRAREAPEAGAISRLAPAEARALFPALREDAGAIHVAGAARLDGRLVAAALCRAAVRRGAVAVAGTAELILEGGRALGVRVGGEAHHAGAVLAAVGSWARDFLAPAGLDVAVAPQRGQIVHLRLPGIDTAAWPLLLPMNSHYLLAFDDSRVVVGATREPGTGHENRLTAGGVAQVLNAGLAIAPGLASATLIEVRVGFRPASADGLPLLGRAGGIEGLWIGNGLGPNGLTAGAAAGRLLAEAMLGAVPESRLAPFRPDRFAATPPAG